MSSQHSHLPKLRKNSQLAQTRPEPYLSLVNSRFAQKFVYALACAALTILLATPIIASEQEGLTSLVEESFTIISKPNASEHERLAALETLEELKKNERREAAEMLLPFMDTVHIYEQLALPRAYKALGKVAVPTLTNSVETTDNKRTRRVGIFVLGEMRDAKSIPLFLDMLNHDDWLTRRAAVGAIGKLEKRARRYAPQLHAAANDEYEVVRISVAIALGKLKNEASAATLGAMLNDPYFSVRFTAAAALAQLGKSGKIELGKALTSDNGHIQYAALTALDKSLARKMTPTLIPLLHNESWPIRARAYQVLSRTGDKKINLRLQKARRDETHQGLASAFDRGQAPN